MLLNIDVIAAFYVRHYLYIVCEESTPDRLLEAQSMIRELLKTHSPAEIGQKIGVIYQTVLLIGNGKLSWISDRTYEALQKFHASRRPQTRLVDIDLLLKEISEAERRLGVFRKMKRLVEEL